MIEYLYEGVKRKLTEDIIIAYELFQEEYQNIEGVILSLNASKDFGLFLKEYPSKLADFSEHVFNSVDFTVQIVFMNDSEIEFYPLFEK